MKCYTFSHYRFGIYTTVAINSGAALRKIASFIADKWSVSFEETEAVLEEIGQGNFVD